MKIVGKRDSLPMFDSLGWIDPGWFNRRVTPKEWIHLLVPLQEFSPGSTYNNTQKDWKVILRHFQFFFWFLCIFFVLGVRCKAGRTNNSMGKSLAIIDIPTNHDAQPNKNIIKHCILRINGNPNNRKWLATIVDPIVDHKKATLIYRVG